MIVIDTAKMNVIQVKIPERWRQCAELIKEWLSEETSFKSGIEMWTK